MDEKIFEKNDNEEKNKKNKKGQISDDITVILSLGQGNTFNDKRPKVKWLRIQAKQSTFWTVL